MAGERHKRRPEPPKPPPAGEPPIYGGQWGPGDEAHNPDPGRPDRPEPIKAPRDSDKTPPDPSGAGQGDF